MGISWWSRRSIGLHVALVVSVPGFFALGWWQLHRALSGNELSWVYTFEWPFFAAYAVWMWWKLLHDDEPPARSLDRAAGAERRRGLDASTSAQLSPTVTVTASPGASEDQSPAFDPYDESEPELAAYNRYLAGLHAADGAEPTRKG